MLNVSNFFFFFFFPNWNYTSNWRPAMIDLIMRLNERSQQLDVIIYAVLAIVLFSFLVFFFNFQFFQFFFIFWIVWFLNSDCFNENWKMGCKNWWNNWKTNKVLFLYCCCLVLYNQFFWKKFEHFFCFWIFCLKCFFL